MTSTSSHPTRYLSPKIDLAFKRVFGENADLLKSFLNALLPLPEDAQIESLTYLPAEQAPVLPLIEKYSIVDVKCTDTKGRIFIVEMQMLWTAYFGQRIVFGASQAYVKQLKRSQTYDLLQPVYALALVNSIFDTSSSDYYHHYKIIKVGDPAKTLDGLEFVFVELPKFKPESRTDKRMTRLWLRFMNEIGEVTEQTPAPELQSEPDIAKAMQMMEVSAYDEAELAAYDHSLDEWRSAKTLVAGAKAEGLAEGKAEGLAEGETKGKTDIAKAMKAMGMDTATIAQLTGLAPEDIGRL